MKKTKCEICGHSFRTYADAVILKKYQVSYYKCENCSFIQTESPYWLTEAYSSAIADGDTGSVNRAFTQSLSIKALILLCFDPKARFLDYGAGYGLFVRRMRDLGLNFFYYDKYCENLFAKGFEITFDSNEKYELVTAIEVFEHLTSPFAEILDLACLTDNIFFTTNLLPSNNPHPNDWWYFAPEHGQHIAFYTRKTLEIMAARLGYHYCSDNVNQHLFSKKKLPELKFRFIMRPIFTLARRLKNNTLLKRDFEALNARKIS